MAGSHAGRKGSGRGSGGAATAAAVKAQGAGIGGSRQTLSKYRSQIPATTLNYKQALPVSLANRPRLARAMDVKQRALDSVPFREMEKLRLRAMVANNPNSVLSSGERKKAISALAKAELQNRKKERSFGVAARAEKIYTNVAGVTPGEGRTKWRRSGQRATSLGAGTMRGGPRRSISGQSPAANGARTFKRRRSTRAWYERAAR